MSADRRESDCFVRASSPPAVARDEKVAAAITGFQTGSGQMILL